ncbi:MAG: MBL fold metallo-hydrolase [Synechococcaceae cyanobacterium SM1_2_3]|nr:MBL fold metallo-hydrolase [Synechococcaceae cyanobacterium SM1_2_3]
MSATHSTFDMGVLKRLRIVCISETGWFDTAAVFEDIKGAGGAETDQYTIPWPPFGALHADNAAGFSALLEAEATDGTVRRLLFDTGWGPDWMDRRFAEEGIDQLLQQGQIEALIISHEHFDHFWGIGSTLKHCPGLTIYVPEGFHPAGFAHIRQQGHTGTVITVPTGQPLLLLPGVALVSFPMSTLLQVQGENVLYANLQDQGLAMVTGCGHGGVLNLLDYARCTFSGGERIHAIYGGLHIAPLEDWDESRQQVVNALSGYGIAKVACNHCTGRTAVEKMLEAGLPVLRGAARNGSQTELFVGNGDVLELG